MTQNLTAHWRWLSGLTALSLAAGFLGPLAFRPPDLQEKRTLAELPTLPQRLSELAGFRKGLDVYVADRFPARPFLIGGLNGLRLPFQVSGSPRVIVGQQGWLFYDRGDHLGSARNSPPLTADAARIWLEHLAGRSEALNGRYLVVAPPMKETVFPRHAPRWFGGPDPDRAALLLSRWAADSQAGHLLYLHEPLTAPTRWGVKTYSPHDTHWTGLGAYYAYVAIMDQLQTLGLGEPARPLTDFREKEPAATDPHDLALMLGTGGLGKPDFIQFDDPPTERRATITYLSQNHSWSGARVVDTGEVGKPVLLITVDSFSTALLPFLYGHFSRLIIAHNDEGVWRPDLIARFKPDLVILEVVESGLPATMVSAPRASPEALERIATVTAGPLTVRSVRRMASDAGAVMAGGGLGDDLRGRQGADTLDGLGGDDVMRGGRGDDLLRGGVGDDWLSGDRGRDTLWGGAGADVFHSFAEADDDRVMDFSVAQGDRIALDAGSTYQIRQSGADAVLIINGKAQIILVGIDPSAIKPAMIMIAH